MAYYPYTCDTVPAHIACSCEVELGRVRSAALIHTSFYSQFMTAPEDEATWAAGIEAGFIVVVPESIGTFNGGEPIYGRGFGFTEETLTAQKFEVAYVDPDYLGNLDFYNSINGSRNWHIAFCSETILRISDKTCSIFASDKIENDLKKEVVWNVTAKWTWNKTPQHYTIPDNIFTCSPAVSVGASFDNSSDNSFDIP